MSFGAGYQSYVKGEPLDADYGSKKAQQHRLGHDMAQHIQQDYERGRLQAAADRANNPMRGSKRKWVNP